MRTCPAPWAVPWGMSAQEHTFTFCQICFISGGNYTLITCIQYTTMVTHSECEISESWRTQFSSHGALNLNRAVMPPPSPIMNFSKNNFFSLWRISDTHGRINVIFHVTYLNVILNILPLCENICISGFRCRPSVTTSTCYN